MNAHSYQILARKYRPQNFSDLIGQEAMVRTLKNAFQTGRIAQSWMLSGVRGVGKTTTARILARALNYQTEENDYPNIEFVQEGLHCQAIIEGRHMDVVEMDAASHTGIDDIREIIEQIHYKPLTARYKIYIIDEVHMLSNQAFNGLLKTLEEPPPHVKFIFATTEIQKVPVTILSRCQRFDLRRVPLNTLSDFLKKIADKENISYQWEALILLAKAATGSVRDALSLLDQAIAYGNGKITSQDVEAMLGYGNHDDLIALFTSIMEAKTTEALAQAKQQYDKGLDPLQLLQQLADINHRITKKHFTPNIDDPALTPEQNTSLTALAKELSVVTLSRSWKMILNAIEELKQAFFPFEALEMAIIRLCHAAHLPQLDIAEKAFMQLLKQEETIKTPPAETLTDSAEQSLNFENDAEKTQNSNFTIEKDKQSCSFETFEDLLTYVTTRKEAKLQYWLKESIAVEFYQKGNLRYHPIGEAIFSATEAAKILKALTGINWQIEAVPAKEEAPILSHKQKIEEAYRSEAQSYSFIQKTLQNFPEAEIIICSETTPSKEP